MLRHCVRAIPSDTATLPMPAAGTMACLNRLVVQGNSQASPLPELCKAGLSRAV